MSNDRRKTEILMKIDKLNGLEKSGRLMTYMLSVLSVFIPVVFLATGTLWFMIEYGGLSAYLLLFMCPILAVAAFYQWRYWAPEKLAELEAEYSKLQ